MIHSFTLYFSSTIGQRNIAKLPSFCFSSRLLLNDRESCGEGNTGFYNGLEGPPIFYKLLLILLLEELFAKYIADDVIGPGKSGAVELK